MAGARSLYRPRWRRDFHPADACPPLFGSGGISIQRDPLWLGRHAHACFELHWLDAGTLVVDLADGRRLSARGGDLMLTAPGTVHRGERDIIPPSRLLWLQCDPMARGAASGSTFSDMDLSVLAQRLRRAGDTVVSAPGLRPIYRRLHALLRTGGAPAAIRAEQSLFLIGAVERLDAADDGARDPLALAALDWMRQHPDQPLKVTALARRLGASPSRFHAAFLAATGETPAACHVRLRIARACDLLHRQSAEPLQHIAELCGFTGGRYFATCFRRLTGLTPSRWRSLHSDVSLAPIDRPALYPQPMHPRAQHLVAQLGAERRKTPKVLL